MARILIAEDKDDVGNLLEEILKHEGHKTVLAANGQEAISILKDDDKFDLLLTDVIMPVIDGFGLIAYATEHKPDLPIIAVSGGGVTVSPDNALQSVEGKVSALLKKPVSISALNDAIKDVLG